ncbi:MAG: Trp biosynthesis-associated membrane protein [Bowdeniella nasicola]|nr:Trp biosynthesis-associated membrane protein [Bowdeniella nasicola]
MTRRATAFVLIGLGVIIGMTSITGWIRADVTSIKGVTQVVATGLQIAPLAGAGALVLLAAGFALFFAHTWGSRVICGVAALASLAVIVSMGRLFLADPERVRDVFLSATSGTGDVAELVTMPAIWVGLTVSILAFTLSIAGVFFAGRWKRPPQRFDPARQSIPTDSRMRAIDDWDALEHGADPTE